MTVRSRPTLLAAAGAATIALALTGCASGQAAGGGAGGAIEVVASTNVWGSVVKAVGGDAVQVTSIIDDPSKDPHDYEVKPADTAKISKAALLVSNGVGYDDFFAKAVSAAAAKTPSVVAFEVSGKAKTEDTNEHVFYDLPTVRKVADKVAEQLGAVQADKKATFQANAKALDTKLDELIARAAKIGTDHPGRQVLVTEPVANYLLASAGVRNATPEAFEKAVEAGSDIPVAAVGEATELVSGKKVAALVNNAQAETEVTKQLKAKAATAGVPVVDVTETLPAGVTDYVVWISKEVDALSNALAKQ
ncbi:zinc ABC transporter substrate-binding protein [Kutzneria viridogrisea]|uniref:Periplasmic solute binding protein n=2 Tax=Kutzneria TaxID=43356 RepID=W5VZ98_9PSEU|nr:zinc ABC transporter substrate-binding protein [Kutzneria albida]AHH93785.1 periplasmic solute binding protein [Kutzneria albida DSM 43870]MBA8931210.1 zinc/manganese transport system substrate-binding protein [Kutzneria viridogrisea]